MVVDREKLTIAMARACMNAQDLAKAAEMPPQTVNRALLGRGVRPATVGRIARALNCDVSEILNLEAMNNA